MATTTACAAAATGTGAQIPSADSWDGQGELEKAVKTDELDEWTVVKKKKGRGAKENDEHTKPKTKSSGRAHVASLTTINPFPNLLGPMRSEKKGDSEKSTDEDEDGPSAKVEGVKLVERASSIQEEPTGDVEEDGDKKEAKEDEGEAAGEARFDLWIARSHSRSDPEWTDVLMLATAAISGSLFLKMMTEVNGGESLPLLEHLFRASKDKRAQWSFDKPTASFSAKHRVAGERADFNHVLKRWDARRVIVTRERFTPDTHGDFVPVRLGLKATGRILDTEYKQWQTAWEMLVALLIEWTPEECPVCASSGLPVVVAVVDATHFEHPEHTRLTLELWLLGGEKEAEREQYRGGLSRHEGKGSRREVVCKECLTRASDALIMLGASTLGASGGGRPSEEKYKFCILDDVGGSKKKSKKTRN